MTKLLGSLFVFCGGILSWYIQHRERRCRAETLDDLLRAFSRMEQEIRLTKTPMPVLLGRQASLCSGQAGSFFAGVRRGIKTGEPFSAAWVREAEGLPLPEEERREIAQMAKGLQGDEESACKAILLACNILGKRAEEWEKHRPEEEKRSSALCLCSAALVVILLL